MTHRHLLPLVVWAAVACTDKDTVDEVTDAGTDDTDATDTDDTDAPGDSDDTDVAVETDTDSDAVDTDDTDAVDTDDVDTDDTDDVDTDDTDRRDTGVPDDPDLDHDGYPASTDCDDARPTVHPGAPEICDTVSNGCDPTWTSAAEDGIVTHVSLAGAVTDLTSQFTGAYTLPHDGLVLVCAGTYEVQLTAEGAAEIAVHAPYGSARTTLDGGGVDRVLLLDDATVDVVGLTITGGDGDPDGGGIWVAQGLVHVDGSRIVGNEARSFGGGVAVAAGGTAYVERTFVDENAAAAGGGVSSFGALGMREVALRRNTATAGGGLAAASPGDALPRATVSLQDVSFVENETSEEGGGFALYDVDASFERVLLDHDHAGSSGGGGFVAAGPGGGVGIAGLRAVGCEATWGGGLAASVEGPLAIDGADLEANVATGTGGGLHATVAATATFVVMNAAIHDNEAGAGGGLVLTGPGTVGLDTVSVTGNAATQAGGGFWIEGATVALQTGEVAGNRVDAPAGAEGQAAAGFWVQSGLLGLTDVDVRENTFAAGIPSYGGGLYVQDSTVALTRSLVRGHVATAGGGAAVTDGGALLLSDGGLVAGNQGIYGAAVYLAEGALGCDPDDPTTLTGVLANAAPGDGAAVMLDHADAGVFAHGCDLGTPATGNDNQNGSGPGADVLAAGDLSTYGDDATFTCDASGCVP